MVSYIFSWKVEGIGMLQSHEFQDDSSGKADTASVMEDTEQALQKYRKKKQKSDKEFCKKIETETHLWILLRKTMQNKNSRKKKWGWVAGNLCDNEKYEKMEQFPTGRHGSSYARKQNKLAINLNLANDEAGLIDFFAIGIFKPTYPLIGKGTSKLKGFGSKKMLAGLELKKRNNIMKPLMEKKSGENSKHRFTPFFQSSGFGILFV